MRRSAGVQLGSVSPSGVVAWSGRPGQPPTRGSHGSGRARLAHPALQIMGSLHDDRWSGRRWLRGAGSVPQAGENEARTCTTVRLGDSYGRAVVTEREGPSVTERPAGW